MLRIFKGKLMANALSTEKVVVSDEFNNIETLIKYDIILHTNIFEFI
jgi:hypothetical protein